MENKMKDVFWFGVLPMRIPEDYNPDEEQCIMPEIYFPMGYGKEQYNTKVLPIMQQNFAHVLGTEREFQNDFNLDVWNGLLQEVKVKEALLLRFWINCYAVEADKNLPIPGIVKLSKV